MMNAEQIAEMDDAQKLDALLSLAEKVMPGATVGTIADRLGINRRTWHQWKETPGRIPAMVLMLLDAWSEQRDATGPARALQGVTETMEQLADRLGDLAREMKP